jgi:ATP-dependent 26S proteasome regulatory subunit
LIFDGLESTCGVYLFDEVDALGSKRGAQNDVGEIRRVLNSFLQFLERDESESLIIGATNHPELLDRALFRRFDAVIEYELPPKELARRVIQARLSLLDVADIDWDSILAAADGLSHADITRACESAAKDAILDHRTRVRTGDLLGALNERRSPATCCGSATVLGSLPDPGGSPETFGIGAASSSLESSSKPTS